ncbi:NAD(P)-binding protein [Amycolatopsis acidicola]|uniref:NAD(P)-binding protein n=1 Tax=Amycolatopsis acidicola TaxID=2596893 RepID=A0A5N0V5P3_9PSEU|nr:FAD-dependent monooxygenase [Amycolatopsis acidicola]KAA9160718.1 NAD(P)-binding protein [Amycolatopsis acidicola]
MNSSTTRTALVVGGGIAGLTHAVALARAGHDVEVVEISAGHMIAGWGLSLTAPSLRALDGLGLADSCIAEGYGVQQIANCDAEGVVRNTIDLPSLLGKGRPAQVGLARPALHRVLRDAALDAGAEIRTESTVTAIDEEPDRSVVTLSDGRVRVVDVVVGADGIRSGTRSLLGIPGEPRFTGQMVWRALVPRPEWATMLHTFAGARHGAGVVPISEEQAYVFVTENDAPSDALPEDTLASTMRELLSPFGGRVAELRETITEPAGIVRRPVQVVLVDGPWHAGRSVLIGDAAHAPSPQLVSGAALAIEDAVVLAAELGAEPVVEKALAGFGHRRLERCRLVVDTSVRIGELERAGRHAEVYPLQERAHRALAAPA